MRRALRALTAGTYSERPTYNNFGADFQSSHLRFWLNQAGITEVDEIHFRPTLLTNDPVGDLARAKHSAAALARRHGAGITAMNE